MKVEAKDILNRLKGPGDRCVKSIYVSKKLWKDFEKSCSGVAASKVIEDLMIQFIQSAKKR